jgi:hypothetical protein
METRIQILTELQEIAPFLAKRDPVRFPYAVSPGYFNDFTEILMNRIRFEDAASGESLSGSIFPQEISDVSPKNEISNISSLLAGLQHKNPYQVPVDYFEGLTVKIPSDRKINSRTISLPMRLVRYATAACIVGLIGIAVFNIKYHQAITDPIKDLSDISVQEMANYLDADDIHWTPGVTSPTETASVELSDNDIHDLLSNVPDDELEQYSKALPVQKGTVN